MTERGFTGEAVARFRFGVVDRPVPGHEHVVGRLSIPYVTPSGIVGMKFRCMLHDDCKEVGCVKYIYAEGEELRLYNTGRLTEDHPHIVVTEGELDAVAVECMAGLPAVGYPGRSAWHGRSYWSRAFAGYEAVFIMADGDAPGRKAATEVAQLISAATVIRLPDGQDSNSILLAEGWQAFHTRLGLGDYGD